MQHLKDMVHRAYAAGDLRTAEDGCREIILAAPGDKEATFILSDILYQLGNPTEAEKLIRPLAEMFPDNPAYSLALTNALADGGHVDESLGYFRQAGKAAPETADIPFSEGAALLSARRIDGAITCFRSALEIDPRHLKAMVNLGMALRLSGADLGEIAEFQKKTAEEYPEIANVWFNLGNTLVEAKRIPEAISALQRAVELAPEREDIWVNLGNTFVLAGDHQNGKEAFQRAISIQPGMQEAYLGLVYLEEEPGEDGIEIRETVLRLNPDLPKVRSSLLMCMQYAARFTRRELLDAHLKYGQHHADPLGEDAPDFPIDRYSEDRPLKMGFVSANFRFHAIYFNTMAPFLFRDRSQWSLYVYSSVKISDFCTEKFRNEADHWRDVRHLDHEQLDDLIRADEIDVLIDMDGHVPSNRLLTFARKPAPVQLSWLDYMGTRGIKAIDGLICDSHHIPPDDEEWYIEHPYRMPDDFVCFHPAEYAPPVSTPPILKNGWPTFGTFSEPTKIHVETIDIWCDVLKTIPSARFVMNNFLLSDAERGESYVKMFEDRGVSRDRIKIMAGGEHGSFLSQYRLVDAILDTWPFSGGLTTLEAIWQGVPVIALTGERFSGRHATAHLSTAGFPEWIAKTPAEMTSIAKRLTDDPGTLAELRAGMREKVAASPICDHKKFSDDFFSLIRSAWKNRCRQITGDQSAPV